MVDIKISRAFFSEVTSFSPQAIRLIEKDINGAKEGVQAIVKNLNSNKIPIEKLILSKSMGNVKFIDNKGSVSIESSYKNNNQPHIQVALKMYKRDPGNAPRSGDRIPYVFIKYGSKNTKQYEKAEDPKWVISQKLELDTQYYLDHQIKNPVLDLMRVVLEDAENQLFNSNQRKITSFFTAQ